MIGHVRVDTDDLSRAAAFHGALLAEMGARRFMEEGRDPYGNKLNLFCIVKA